MISRSIFSEKCFSLLFVNVLHPCCGQLSDLLCKTAKLVLRETSATVANHVSE